MNKFLTLLLILPLTLIGQDNSKTRLNHMVDSINKSITKQSDKNRKKQFTIEKIENGNGFIIEYGTLLMGYTSNVFDTSNYNKITAIREYKNNRLDGKSIQFFNYPSDTASIENYKNGKLHGNFFYNYPNGNERTKAVFMDGKPISITRLTPNGEKIEECCNVDTTTNLFYDESGYLNGHKVVYFKKGIEYTNKAADLYFSNGRIDSAWLYHRYGYWGKTTGAVKVNYIDSVRTSVTYHAPSGNPRWIYKYKILEFNPKKKIPSDTYETQRSIDNDEFERDGKYIHYYDEKGKIKSISYYKNGVKVDEVLEYDEEGNLIDSIEK